jgi:hypothetical protein
VRRSLVLIACLLAAASVVYALKTSPVAQCYAAPLTGRVEIRAGVFVDPSMPAGERARVGGMIGEAEGRVAGYFGNRQADPRILTRSAGTATYRTPLCDCIFLGPKGRNVDVIAHELAHTEISARAGHLRTQFAIPTWFDEGAAMHVDLRPEYGEAAYRELLRSAGIPKLADIDTPRKFFPLNRRAYVTAKHEFEGWYSHAGRAGFLALFEDVRAGRSFQEAYNAR